MMYFVFVSNVSSQIHTKNKWYSNFWDTLYIPSPAFLKLSDLDPQSGSTDPGPGWPIPQRMDGQSWGAERSVWTELGCGAVRMERAEGAGQSIWRGLMVRGSP